MEILYTFEAEESARIADAMRQADTLGWLKQVEDFVTASGSRCFLDHVTQEQWLSHYAANDDAYTAVMDELERVSE